MNREEWWAHIRQHHRMPGPEEKKPVIQTYGMNDVGTRLEHMMQLQDLWGFGLQQLTTNNVRHSQKEVEQAKKLESALELLTYHMMNDYDATVYAKEINDLKIGDIT